MDDINDHDNYSYRDARKWFNIEPMKKGQQWLFYVNDFNLSGNVNGELCPFCEGTTVEARPAVEQGLARSQMDESGKQLAAKHFALFFEALSSMNQNSDGGNPDSGAHRPNSNTGYDGCSAPSLGVFDSHGRVVSFKHGSGGSSYAPLAKVDSESPRKDGLPYKLGLSHASNDNSNLAFSSTDGGRTLSGFRYNLSWDRNGKVPFSAAWNCNHWQGMLGSEPATLIP